MKVFDFDPQQPTPPEDERAKFRRAVDVVRKFMMASHEYRRPHVELSVQCREMYQCWVKDGRSLLNRANLRLPYAFSIVETEVPKIVETMLKERPVFKLEGRRQEDLMLEDVLEDFLDGQLENMGVEVKLTNYVKSMLQDGTAIAKIPYRFQEKEVENRSFERDETTGDLKVKYDTDFRIAFDGPDWENIPFIDFFPDWSIKNPGDVQAMRGCAHRTWRTYAQLQSNPSYKNVEELDVSLRVKNWPSDKDVAWAAPYFSEEWAARYDLLNDNRPGYKNQELIEVWEWWGQFDETGNGDFREYVITIANGDCCVRCEANPFKHKMKPFIATPNTIRDNEFYGIPEILAIKALVKEANTLRNSRLDQVNLAVNAMYIADRSAGIKARTLYARPSGIIWTNDINGIKRLDPPESPASAWRELQELQVEMKDALGVTEGTPQFPQAARTFGRTATGVQFVNNIAASRVGLKVRILGATGIRPMCAIMLKIDDQFVTDEQWVRVNDPQQAAQNPFKLLQPSAFERSLDFMIKTPFDTGGKDVELQALQQLAQLLQTAESTQPGITRWDVLFEDIGRKLVGSRVRKFIRSDEERQQLQMQQLAAQQSMQAQQGARAPQTQPGQQSGRPVPPNVAEPASISAPGGPGGSLGD